MCLTLETRVLYLSRYALRRNTNEHEMAVRVFQFMESAGTKLRRYNVKTKV